MNKGDLRSSIMYACPEDFVDELNSYLDDIEDIINDALCDIDTNDTEDAVGKLKDLSKGLY